MSCVLDKFLTNLVLVVAGAVVVSSVEGVVVVVAGTEVETRCIEGWAAMVLVMHVSVFFDLNAIWVATCHFVPQPVKLVFCLSRVIWYLGCHTLLIKAFHCGREGVKGIIVTHLSFIMQSMVPSMESITFSTDLMKPSCLSWWSLFAFKNNSVFQDFSGLCASYLCSNLCFIKFYFQRKIGTAYATLEISAKVDTCNIYGFRIECDIKPLKSTKYTAGFFLNSNPYHCIRNQFTSHSETWNIC